jgi:hypothetical protein
LDGETSFDTKQRKKLRNVWITGRQGLTEREAASMLIYDSRCFLQKELGLAHAKWDNQESDISGYDSQSPSKQSVHNAQEQYECHDKTSKCPEQTINQLSTSYHLQSSPLLLKELKTNVSFSDRNKMLTERERRNSLCCILSGYDMQKCLSPELNDEDYVSSSPLLKCSQNRSSQIHTSRKFCSRLGKTKNSGIISGSIPKNASSKRSIFKSKKDILSKEQISESFTAGKPYQSVCGITNQTQHNKMDSSNFRTVNCSLSKENRSEQEVLGSSPALDETSDSSLSASNGESNKFPTKVNRSIDYFGSPLEISESKLHEKTQQFKMNNKPQISNESSSENSKREATVVSIEFSNNEECLRTSVPTFRITDNTLVKNNEHLGDKSPTDEYLLNDNMNQEHKPLKRGTGELSHKVLNQNISTSSSTLSEEIGASEKVTLTKTNNKRGSSDFFSSPVSGGNSTLHVEGDNQSPVLFGDSFVMNTQLNNMLDGGCDEHPTTAELNCQNQTQDSNQISSTDHIIKQVPYDVKNHRCLTSVTNCGVSRGEGVNSEREWHKPEEESSPVRSLVSGSEILNSAKLDTENTVSELSSYKAEVNDKMKGNISFKKQSCNLCNSPKGTVTALNVMKQENNKSKMLDRVTVSAAYRPEMESLELRAASNIVRDSMGREGVVINLSSSDSMDKDVLDTYGVHSEELDFCSITEQTPISHIKYNFKTKKGLVSPAVYNLKSELRENIYKCNTPLKETLIRKRKSSISNDFNYSESELSFKKRKRISNKCKIDSAESEMDCTETKGSTAYWLHTEYERALESKKNVSAKGPYPDKQEHFTHEKQAVVSVVEQNLHIKKPRVNEVTGAEDADCITDSFFERAFDTYWDLDNDITETKKENKINLNLELEKSGISVSRTNPLHELHVHIPPNVSNAHTSNKPDTKDKVIPAASSLPNQRLGDNSNGGKKVNLSPSVISNSFLEVAFSTSWEEKFECKEINNEIFRMKQHVSSDSGSNMATEGADTHSNLRLQEPSFNNKETEGQPFSKKKKRKKSDCGRRRSPRLMAAAIDKERRQSYGSSAEVCKVDLVMKFE